MAVSVIIRREESSGLCYNKRRVAVSVIIRREESSGLYYKDGR